MKPANPPQGWSIFAIPAALALFYCVMLCLRFPHLPSTIPSHFDATGMPDAWMRTGPWILLSFVCFAILFPILGYAFRRGGERPGALRLVAIVVAGVCGLEAGAFLETLHVVNHTEEFRVLVLLAWAVCAAAAEATLAIVARAMARKQT